MRKRRIYNFALYSKLRVALDRINHVKALTDKKEIIPALNVTSMLIEEIIEFYRPLSMGRIPRITESIRAKVIQLIKDKTPRKVVAQECRISKTAVGRIVRQERLYNYPQKRGNWSGGSSKYPFDN